MAGRFSSCCLNELLLFGAGLAQVQLFLLPVHNVRQVDRGRVGTGLTLHTGFLREATVNPAAFGPWPGLHSSACLTAFITFPQACRMRSRRRAASS